MPATIFQMIGILCGIYSGPQYSSCSKGLTMCVHGKKGPMEHVSVEVWKNALDDCTSDDTYGNWKKK